MTAIALILALLALLGWAMHARFLRRALHAAWSELDQANLAGAAVIASLRTQLANVNASLAHALSEQTRIADEHERRLDEVCASFDAALTATRAKRDAHAARCEDLEQQVAALTERQDTHLRMIANLSQSTPLAEELQGWEGQRAALIAEVGTLRAGERNTRERIADACAAVSAFAARQMPRETSASIARWQNETFGSATTDIGRVERIWLLIADAFDVACRSDLSIPRPNLSRAIRAAEELAELIELLVENDADPKAPEECADIDIVLRGVDAAHGVERTDTVDEKMERNRSRLWHTTGDGHGQHVETVDGSAS